MKNTLKLLALSLLFIQTNIVKSIELCPDCPDRTKFAQLYEAPRKNNSASSSCHHNAIEQCPGNDGCTCTKSGQLHDATQEVNQLAHASAPSASRPHNAACNCTNGGACTCPQGQCHCSPQCHNNSSDEVLEQTVLSSFATMVQSIFNIAQNPRNSQIVGTNIAQMLAGIVNVAKEVIHRMPESATMEEKEAYLEEVELALKRCLRSLARMRKQLA